MENPIISDVRTQALKKGLADGMEICRKMLCKSLGKEFDSFGSALGHLDMMIIEMERAKREQTTIDE
jgi:hypothetical protein